MLPAHPVRDNDLEEVMSNEPEKLEVPTGVFEPAPSNGVFEPAAPVVPEVITFNTVKEELDYLNLQEARDRAALVKFQLAEAQAAKEERQLNLRNIKESLADRELKTMQRQEDRESQGRTFAQQSAQDAGRQGACSHKKGGIVSPRNLQVLHTGGNGNMFAVIKHRMINGDLWVRCQRCNKTWTPPVKENYFFERTIITKDGRLKGVRRMPAKTPGGAAYPAPGTGQFSPELFKTAQEEYLRACAFDTNNTESASVQCKFTKWNELAQEWVDATVDFRTRVADTDLR